MTHLKLIFKRKSRMGIFSEKLSEKFLITKLEDGKGIHGQIDELVRVATKFSIVDMSGIGPFHGPENWSVVILSGP